MYEKQTCAYCNNGIGLTTYGGKEAIMNGKVFCTSDCYSDALTDELGFGLKGKFDFKTDGHGGVELIES